MEGPYHVRNVAAKRLGLLKSCSKYLPCEFDYKAIIRLIYYYYYLWAVILIERIQSIGQTR